MVTIPPRSRIDCTRIRIRRAKILLGLLIVLVGLSGCAVSIAEPQRETKDSAQLCRQPEFSLNHLGGDKFTILAPRLVVGKTSQGPLVVSTLVAAFNETIPGSSETLVHHHVTQRRLNQNHLTEKYSTVLNRYDCSGSPNGMLLERITEAAQVRHVAVPILLDANEQTHGRLSFFGLTIFKTRNTTVRFPLQVWDARRGDMFWEGYSDPILAQEAVRERPVPFRRIFQLNWEKLLRTMSWPGARRRNSRSPGPTLRGTCCFSRTCPVSPAASYRHSFSALRILRPTGLGRGTDRAGAGDRTPTRRTRRTIRSPASPGRRATPVGIGPGR